MLHGITATPDTKKSEDHTDVSSSYQYAAKGGCGNNAGTTNSSWFGGSALTYTWHRLSHCLLRDSSQLHLILCCGAVY